MSIMRYKGIKGKAWEAVKAWTRRTYKDCYTCGAKNLVGKNAQAGHYQPVALVGSNNNKAWDSRFIRFQCGFCNGMGQGMQVIFRQNLVKEHGKEVVAKLDKEVMAKKIDKVENWNTIIEHFNSLNT